MFFPERFPSRKSGYLVWNRIIPILICVAVIFAYWKPLHLDLWNDEIYSLIHFQMVPLSQTATDYHETNNHIFFNLLLNIYLKLIGNPNTLQIFQHPEMVRIVPLFFTLITYLVLYRWMTKMMDGWAGILACLLLTITLPYYNFALQYRAYSLVIMLGMIYGNSLWNYLRYGGKKFAWILFIGTALIFYSHPAGIYLVITLSIAAIPAYAGSLMQFNIQRQRAIDTTGVTLAGVLVGGLAYLPVLNQLLSNQWVAGHKIPAQQFIRDKFISCSFQLISGNYWLLALAATGVIFLFVKRRQAKAQESNLKKWILFSFLVYLITFLIPLLRHDDAPQRTFVILIPFLVTIWTIGLYQATIFIKKNTWRKALLAMISLMILVEIPIKISGRNKKADFFVDAAKENSSMANAYYLHHFHPMKITEAAKAASEKNNVPVYFGNCYRQELPEYLKALGLPLNEYRTNAQKAQAPDSFYIITMFADQFIRQNNSEIHCRIISDGKSYYELIFATKRNPALASP